MCGGRFQVNNNFEHFLFQKHSRSNLQMLKYLKALVYAFTGKNNLISEGVNGNGTKLSTQFWTYILNILK